jgi:hypothetical protein
MVDRSKTMFFHPRQFLHTLTPIALMLEVGQEVSQPREKIQNLVNLVFCWSGGRNGSFVRAGRFRSIQGLETGRP